MTLPGLGQELVALHLGHALVRDDDRDVRLFPEDVERLDRRRGGQHPVIVLEQVLERDQDVRLVVDDQDRAMRWVHLTRQGHATICLGIVMVKLAPPCGPASTVIDPLWA